MVFGSDGATVSIVVKAVDQFSKTFKKAEAGVAGFVKQNKAMIAATGTAMVGAGLAGIAVMSDFASEASNLQESVNAVTVAYGDNAAGVLKLGEASATSFGMSKSQFNSAAVSFSAFAETIVGEGGDVVGVVGDITTRTADFASVMNLDLGRAQTLMQAGLAGETEGLRRFGIDVSAATVKSYAYANGIAEAGTELTESQKIQARYGTIMEQTSKYQGDFANTSGDLANSQRILKASFADLKADLGNELLPTFEKIVGVLQAAVNWFSELPGPVKQSIVIVGGLVAVLSVLGGVVLMLTAATAAFTAVNIWWIAGIIAAIAVVTALVAAGVYLWKHWDELTEKAKKLGVDIQNVFIGMGNVVIKVWNWVVNYIETSINRIISMVNHVIKAMNKIPGFNFSTIRNLDLSRFEGEMMGYKTYTPATPSSSGSSTTNVFNIGNINGMTGKDLANSLQQELNNKMSTA